ncbi:MULTISPECIES: DUF2474 domain-containing protein [Yersinia]|uniref:DUF2474 domain-containing protein n=1 Tax=Yersinia TaxID=629 RepID=UPI0007E2FE61|nr:MULTISPECIES: DUF2474 domain-containing protein [Yersinia]OWF88757.1 DUF2474 domain-containing protein [Yersinia entomophaga]
MFKKTAPASTRLSTPAPWWKKLGWLVLIWCGSVLALLAVSMLFRMLMTAAGMKSH